MHWHKPPPTSVAYGGPLVSLGAAAVVQQIWGRLAVGNFVLGGMGTGAYVLAVLFYGLPGQPLSPVYTVIRLLSPVLVMTGLLSVALEAGHPWRGWRVLTNLRHSWMSRELLLGGVFIAWVASDIVWPHGLFRVAGTAAGVLFCLSQGFLLGTARGIPAWNQRRLPLLFLLSGLQTGAALVLAGAVMILSDLSSLQPLAAATLILTLAHLTVWLAYLRQPRGNPALAQSLGALTRPFSLASSIGVGHLLPMLLLSPMLFLWPLNPSTMLVACVALVLGGVFVKDSLVTRAGYLYSVPIPGLSRISPAIGESR